MFFSRSLIRTGRLLALVLVAAVLVGCKSKEDQALDQAKKQAAANRPAAAGCHCGQERDHDDDGGATACTGTDDRSGFDDVHAARGRDPRAGSGGAESVRSGASAPASASGGPGQCQHPGRHNVGNQD